MLIVLLVFDDYMSEIFSKAVFEMALLAIFWVLVVLTMKMKYTKTHYIPQPDN